MPDWPSLIPLVVSAIAVVISAADRLAGKRKAVILKVSRDSGGAVCAPIRKAATRLDLTADQFTRSAAGLRRIRRIRDAGKGLAPKTGNKCNCATAASWSIPRRPGGNFTSAELRKRSVMVTIRPNLQFDIFPDGDFRHDCGRFSLRSAHSRLLWCGL
jgi:hypothetical protein